ncbi:MAG: hypothetical protein C4576_11360 [Desulfobacteraceae bacterium]|nr:MAG: hypothetical protein C4576_11360 [Desulfobacteraceae bacterium]
MPTYRNDGEVTYRILNISGEAVNVIPGHTVQTFDPVVPDDFTETDEDPAIVKAISGENIFTDWLRKPNANISVSGEGSWTVELQRTFDGGSSVLVVDSYTSSDEPSSISDKDPNVMYRLGVPAGGYTSGTIVVRLSQV